MKKLFFSIVLMFCAINYNQAQLLDLGIKVGGNYSNFDSKNLEVKGLTSYHAGFVAQIKLIKSISIQPEILYSTQGGSYKNALQEYKSELGYMSIPLMVKLHLGKVLTLEGGPQFSYLLTKKITPETPLNEFDLALTGGIGIKLTDQIFLQGRYISGLTNVNENLDLKNKVFQVSLGYMF
jgi:hypothetical protein